MLKNNPINFLICPLEGEGMRQEGKTIKCRNGHTFDISREGYINMLLSKRKLPETVGDNKEMLSARSNFLSLGYYEPIAGEINKIVTNFLCSSKKRSGGGYIIEVGCGTAYYISQLKKHIEEKFPKVNYSYFGTDVSKTATKRTSKKFKDITFIVANTYSHIPVKSGQAHLVMSVFAPRQVKEFRRLVSYDGAVLLVIPGVNHLSEIIKPLDLMSIEQDKENKIKNDFKKGFSLIHNGSLNYQVTLTNEAIVDLVKMGPNYWKTSNSISEKIKNLNIKKISVSVKIMLFTPKPKLLDRNNPTALVLHKA